MQAETQEQISPIDAKAILERLPERTREALVTRADDIEYPIEAVIEMAMAKPLQRRIASFLDSEAPGFADCKPERGEQVI